MTMSCAQEANPREWESKLAKSGAQLRIDACSRVTSRAGGKGDLSPNATEMTVRWELRSPETNRSLPFHHLTPLSVRGRKSSLSLFGFRLGGATYRPLQKV